MGSRPRTSQSGFALVELLVAMAILLVGVLGMVDMIDGASRASSGSKSREGATALAREMLEVTRSARYQELTATGVPAVLRSRAALADSTAGGAYTVARRGFVYTVAISACSVDDPKDGAGPHDGAVTFCADSAPPGATDRNADDYRRVTLALSWSHEGVAKTSRQIAVVSNPAGGLGPSVTALDRTGATSPVTVDLATLDFGVQTASTPASVSWSVNGDTKGVASGSGTSWSFGWQLSGVSDGTYVVRAQAFDAAGRSGVAFSRTVVLNRAVPSAPGGFAGGRNGTPGHVDVEWHASTEGDVVGYRVYRSSAAGAKGTRACPATGAGADAVLQATECVDAGADLLATQHYVIASVDLDAAGNRREGASSPVLAAPLGNLQPLTPLGVLVCLGQTAGCLGPDGLQAPASTTVVSWDPATDPDGTVAFYRIYRDGITYANRYDRVYPSGGPLRYVDRAPGGQVHTYYVTAVDNGYGESPLSLPVVG